MKTLIAMSLAVLLLLSAGYFATTTITTKVDQTCSSESNYQNSWRDVYFFTQQSETGGTPSMDLRMCTGPSVYVRYHPVDVAAVSFLGALTAGFITYRNETMHTKKPKQKETK
jgi:hypothetical protein